MTDPASFHGRLDSGRRRGCAAAALVALVAVSVIGVALAKPWQPTSAPGPTGEASSSPRATLGPVITAPAPTPMGAAPSSILDPTVGFTVPAPPGPGAEWTGVRWHALAPGDPLSYVRSVVRWTGGFVAIGWDGQGTVTKTPAWTSSDGSAWKRVGLNTSTTFWPGELLVSMADVPAGLLAVSQQDRGNECAGDAFCQVYGGVNVWTSADGTTWAARTAPGIFRSDTATGPVHVARRPAGFVAAWTDPGISGQLTTRTAVSTDGIAWTTLPPDATPASFVLEDLVATPEAFLAGGRIETPDGLSDAVILRSADGRSWSKPEPLPVAAQVRLVDTGRTPTEVASLLAGPDGLIAVGRERGTPGATLWWQSDDGVHWQPVADFPPLGPTTCVGGGCGSNPDGVVTGDGQRLVAIRGGARPGFWTSPDGRTWAAGRLVGDGPTEQLSDAVLLPGGVLLHDPNATWYGEAVTD